MSTFCLLGSQYFVNADRRYRPNQSKKIYIGILLTKKGTRVPPSGRCCHKLDLHFWYVTTRGHSFRESHIGITAVFFDLWLLYSSVWAFLKGDKFNFFNNPKMTQGHRYASSRCFNINSFHQVVVWVRCLFNPLSSLCFFVFFFWYMTCPIWWYLLIRLPEWIVPFSHYSFGFIYTVIVR